MAKKSDDDPGFSCVCTACGIEGPARTTALQACESARKAGWEVSADVCLCRVCGYRVNRLERAYEKPPAIR